MRPRRRRPARPCSVIACAADRPTLRFLTCGSVDDGKTTLIGRLLYDSESAARRPARPRCTRESRTAAPSAKTSISRCWSTGWRPSASRASPSTSPIAIFATPSARFIVADTPGHEQYTRNMATGASNADLARLLVDARKGVLAQTRRHAIIARCSASATSCWRSTRWTWSTSTQARFDADRAHEYRELRGQLGFVDVVASHRRARRRQYRSPPASGCPGTTARRSGASGDGGVADDIAGRPFRMPVQWVNRPNADFRGFCGRIASGAVASGDDIAVQPSDRRSRVAKILTPSGESDVAVAGQSVTLVLADEVDVGRGDVLSSGAAAIVSDQLPRIWSGSTRTALLPGRPYLLKSGRAGSAPRCPH